MGASGRDVCRHWRRTGHEKGRGRERIMMMMMMMEMRRVGRRLLMLHFQVAIDQIAKQRRLTLILGGGRTEAEYFLDGESR